MILIYKIGMMEDTDIWQLDNAQQFTSMLERNQRLT